MCNYRSKNKKRRMLQIRKEKEVRMPKVENMVQMAKSRNVHYWMGRLQSSQWIRNKGSKQR